MGRLPSCHQASVTFAAQLIRILRAPELLKYTKWHKVRYGQMSASFSNFFPPLSSFFVLLWTSPPPRARLEELRMFLENETWELCPVKSNFNISQLHVSAQPYHQKLGSVRLFCAVTLACLACDISIWIWNAGDHWFLCLCKNVSLHINMKEGKEKFTAPCIIQEKRWKSACSYVCVDVWGFLYPPNQLKLKISTRWGSSQNPNRGASLMYAVS